MLYVNIPGTTLQVSRLSLGTMNYGLSLTEPEAWRQMDRYLDEGGNFIDTASVYSDWMPGERSRSEKFIGRYLQGGGRRDRIILSTKGAHPALDAFTVSRVTEKDIRNDLEASLQNLHTDHIDLYFLHRDDPEVPIEEIVGIMNALVKEGKLRYFGCSNFLRPRLQAAQEYAAKNGLQGFASNQIAWSLARINRQNVRDKTLVQMDDDYLQYHRESGVHVMAYSSQAKGYFQKLETGSPLSERVLNDYDNAVNTELFSRLRKASAESGIPVSTLCLRYFDFCGFAACPVVSVNNDGQLSQALDAYNQTPDMSALADFFAYAYTLPL